jgi:voltage-gated potassium channel
MTRSVEAQRDERSLKEKLRYYYEADAARAHRFRYALLGFDIVTVLFIIVSSSFFERTLILEVLDVVFGIFILADFSARLSSAGRAGAIFAFRPPGPT